MEYDIEVLLLVSILTLTSPYIPPVFFEFDMGYTLLETPPIENDSYVYDGGSSDPMDIRVNFTCSAGGTVFFLQQSLN